ncbi:MAG: hypothetical protein IPJ65_01105 [Archangiaceae bacterium]|nr:hypothetical protein [Archangiaceae bacterium]
MLSLLTAVLISAEPAAASPAPPAAPAAEAVRSSRYTGRDRTWLLVERDQLLNHKPPLVPQVLVMVGGLFGAGVSAGIAIDRRTSVDELLIGLAIGCAVSATLGAVMLALGLRERFDIDDKLGQVDAALKTAHEVAPPPPAEEAPEDLGAPPPPPPGASLLPALPGLAVR